jgi:cytochrome c peroxidase
LVKRARLHRGAHEAPGRLVARAGHDGLERLDEPSPLASGRAPMQPAHLLSAEEQGQAGVGPLDLALRFIPGGRKVKIGPGFQHEALLGPPGAARDAGDKLLIRAEIHLLDEFAQPRGKIEQDLHPAQCLERNGDNHVVGLDRVVEAEISRKPPAPIFLTSHPELGDISRGQLLTIRNFYELTVGLITPVQMEGLRLLLSPFPQEEFNQTEDRKVPEQSLGVACLDCHSNFHTNGAFHLTPDVRPQAARFRLDTTSLRGMFNQQIHGSKRSLRSVEDFTEFEQRTAYFNGDHVSATRKGVNLPDRPNQVAMMAQMQNMIDFPPAPKLDPMGLLDPTQATEQELAGERVFLGKGQCAVCHIPQTAFMDNNMHDLKLERFYEIGQTVNGLITLPEGAIKTFTLRGIKDSPPYLHDGRLMTLADTVEFFNLVLELKLTQAEKDSVVAYMLAL